VHLHEEKAPSPPEPSEARREKGEKIEREEEERRGGVEGGRDVRAWEG